MQDQADETLSTFLRRNPLFSDLSDADFADIAARIREVTVPRGSAVFNQDDPAHTFFIVIDGWVKVFRTTMAGEEAVIGVFTRGQSFAEIAALARQNYPAHAHAVTDARLAEIPVDRIVGSIAHNPEVALVMLASISRHVRRLVDEIESMKGLSGIQRVAEFLIAQSPVESGACTVRLPYEKALIAAKLGMKAESLSRVFQRLRKFGVHIKRDMAVINDVEALHDVVERERLSAESS